MGADVASIYVTIADRINLLGLIVADLHGRIVHLALNGETFKGYRDGRAVTEN
jgi:hypothetical protein